MPPKKRNRDPKAEALDDDELDKEELKGMLRQSLDEKAELVAKMEEQKAELEAEKEKSDATFLECAFLGLANSASDESLIYYHNFNVVKQARAANCKDLLNVSGALHDHERRGFRSSWYLGTKLGYVSVSSCSALLDLFGTGLKAGTKLKTASEGDSLFQAVVVFKWELDWVVSAGQESQYLILAASSHFKRFNPMLAKALEPQVETVGALKRRERQEDLGLCGGEEDQSIPIQYQAQGVEFNTVVKDVMIPSKPQDGVTNYIKVELNFDRMVYVREDGKELEMGFE